MFAARYDRKTGAVIDSIADRYSLYTGWRKLSAAFCVRYEELAGYDAISKVRETAEFYVKRSDAEHYRPASLTALDRSDEVARSLERQLGRILALLHHREVETPNLQPHWKESVTGKQQLDLNQKHDLR